MDAVLCGSKRRRLNCLVDNLSIKTIIHQKVKHAEESQTVADADGIGPTLWQHRNNIITVQPKEPDRRTKVYVLRKSSNLTSGSYLQCAKCGQSTFKLYRVDVPRGTVSAGGGHMDNKSIQICRRCWTAQGGIRTSLALVDHYRSLPREPLGKTSERALDGWRFLHRDFLGKRKNALLNASVKSDSVGTCADRLGENVSVRPLVSVINCCEGNFKAQLDKADTYFAEGHVLCKGEIPSHVLKDLFHSSTDHAPSEVPSSIDAHLKRQPYRIDCGVREVVDLVQFDHDYLTNVQQEVEVRETCSAAVKPTLPKKTAVPLTIKKVGGKCPGGEPTKTTKQIVAGGKDSNHKKSPKESQKQPPKLDPADAAKLGINCPLCNRTILKSYSCWRKVSTPQQFHHLFRNGQDVVRACRRCIPYKKPRDVPQKKDTKAVNASSKLLVAAKNKARLHNAVMRSKLKAAAEAKPIRHGKVQSQRTRVVTGPPGGTGKPKLRTPSKKEGAPRVPLNVVEVKVEYVSLAATKSNNNNNKVATLGSGKSNRLDTRERRNFRSDAKVTQESVVVENKHSGTRTRLTNNNINTKTNSRSKNNDSNNNNNNTSSSVNQNKISTACRTNLKTVNGTMDLSKHDGPVKSLPHDVTFDADSISFQTGLKSLRSGKIVIFDLNKNEDNGSPKSNLISDGVDSKNRLLITRTVCNT